MLNISELSEVYFEDLSSSSEIEKIKGGSLIFLDDDCRVIGYTETILPGRKKPLSPLPPGIGLGDKYPFCPNERI